MSSLQKIRVLLLDDDQFILDFVSELLRDLGVDEVLVAQDGMAGLNVLSEQVADIDLLICDIEMPEMDGIEFLRNIASQNYCGNIALFSGIDADLLRAAERFAKVSGLRVLGTLSKPVSLGALATILERVSHPELLSAVKKPIQPPDDSKFNLEDVRKAIVDEAFEVYYQPKVTVSDGKIVGFESLARWIHPHYGFIPPDQFIPLIEQTPGLIDEFTQLILKKSVKQLAQWLDQGLDLKAAVNISMENLNRYDLPEIFAKTAQAFNVPLKKIMLEITESKLSKDYALSLDILTRFRIKGFGLSIDDFGTGYATMETLNNLPFTELKIDRMFVNGAVNDASARAIVESSVRLAKEFGLNIVAEGVETEEELELIGKLGCIEAQGYYFSKPVPADEFVQLKSLHVSNR
ncbi:MAG: EAL domain-containing response regulator [Nitrosomonas sp.]|nr:EAL domain-containing response regulator [Nitrosomonas sp.]